MRNRPILTNPIARLAAVLTCAAAFALAHAEPLPSGKSLRSVTINGDPIELNTYKPPDYHGGPILLVLHGLGANAPGYRDYAIPIADAHGYLVIAPLFDRKRFPVWRYQTGGLVRNQRAEGEFEVEPESQWAGTLFLRIIDAVRAMEGNPGLAYSMLGHSAGAQTLSRFAAFVPNAATHIVIANPSTWLRPLRGERFPYGYGGLPPRLSNDAALQRYLAQPVTVLLGTADVRRDNNLNLKEGAERQGANRLERGRNVFNEARDVARRHGWPFAWQLVEVPGIGHSARRMFGSAQALDALAPR